MLIKSLIFLLFFFGCTPAPRYKSEHERPASQKMKSSSKVKFIPVTKAPTLAEFDTSQKVYTGVSSYYGKDFHGKLTANGEIFDMYGVTAAHKTMPLNTVARVTNLGNNKSLILRINDRGPYVEGRMLDCSYGAAKKLDFLNTGTTEVKIEVIEWGDNKYMHH
jgi:rare lipoprotein A